MGDHSQLSLTTLCWWFSGDVTGKMLKCQKPSLESAEYPHFPLIQMGDEGTQHLAVFGPVSADTG